jgi:hypothetical protein
MGIIGVGAKAEVGIDMKQERVKGKVFPGLRPDLSGVQTGNLVPVCVCCRRVPVGGFRDGLVLQGRFLCSACELEITFLAAADPRYSYFRERIREFLHGYLLSVGIRG